MSMLLADFMDHIFAWIGGAIGILFLVIVLMALPDIVRYLRIRNM